MIEQFKNDVDTYLSKSPKSLPSKYFYDEIGDQLFVEIMNMPEYYLTRAEFEIFNNQTEEIVKSFNVKKDTYFELIELGAGDGTKTKMLLKYLLEHDYHFHYFPIDISQNALNKLEYSLKEELPSIEVQTYQGDYFKVLSSFKNNPNQKVLLFLGSNIGNMTDKQATDFLYELGSNLSNNDRLLLGVDLIKSKEIVLPAYNDRKGITRKFNLNLLSRINKELDGHFQLENFEHVPEYTEQEGIAKSFILSKENQTVKIEKLNKKFSFKKGEKIHTEISRKYDDKVISTIIKDTDFSIENKFIDSKNIFADYMLKRN